MSPTSMSNGYKEPASSEESEPWRGDRASDEKSTVSAKNPIIAA